MQILISSNPATSKIENWKELAPGIKDILSDVCSYEVEGAKFHRLYKQGRWDGRKRLLNKTTRAFPTGLLDRVVYVLRQHGLVPEINYESPVQPPALLPNLPDAWAARDYQEEAIEKALDARRGMIRIATGGGKTPVAGHIISRLDTDTLFLVHTKDLLYQAKETFISMFGSGMVGQIGDGVVEPSYITVCTIQTLARTLGIQFQSADEDDTWDDVETHPDEEVIRELIEGVGLVIMDECHRVAGQTAMSVLAAIPNAGYRFGLSASPWRDDGAELALEAAFGEVVVDISASYLIDRGFLVPPIISMIDVPSVQFPKGTKYSTVYDSYVVHNATRNRLGVTAASGMVSRGRTTLVLVRRIDHGTEVANMLSDALGYDVPFISGRDSSNDRLDTIDGLRNRSIPCVVASTIADEGLDIPSLAGIVLLGGGKSSTRALQRIGRVLRPYEGKEVAEVVDFTDNARFLYDHSQRRKEIYQSEERFTILEL